MQISEKIKGGNRLSSSEALQIAEFSMYELSKFAQIRTNLIDPSREVGFIVNRMINYSNVCMAQCKFCAYHARAGRVEPFTMSDEQIFDLCKDAVERGGVQIMLQGGLHPKFTLKWAESLLKKIKNSFPSLWLHVFSPSEIIWFARAENISVADCLWRLKDAGADSIPGAADMLISSIRKELCGNKCTVEEWSDVMRQLAKLGMSSSATMTFGLGETMAQRIEHLDVIRRLQDETGVFKAFIAWPVSPENTAIEGRFPRVGAPEFLKTLALARIYLDNIKYIQSGWLTEGLKVAEVALEYGANDVGGVLMDEMVVRAAGIDNRATAENMRKVIENAGFKPRQRDGLYNTLVR